MTYLIYTKELKSAFAGDGLEYLIADADDKIVLVHMQSWFNPAVSVQGWEPQLVGLPLSERGKGWRKLSRVQTALAHGWAEDMVESHREEFTHG